MCFRKWYAIVFLYIIGFYALILAAAFRVLPEFAATTEDKMFLDFGMAANSGRMRKAAASINA